MPPTYYRGCWHVVSRGLLLSYRQNSSLRTEVYNPKTVFLHAALLHQGFPHCAIFPTAASRRSLSPNVAVQPLSPAMDRRLGGPLPRQLSNPTRAHLSAINLWQKSDATLLRYAVLPSVSRRYSPLKGRLLTRYSPVRHSVISLFIPKESQIKLRSTCMC